MIERSRCGRFTIPRTWLADDISQDLALQILRDCLIVKAEADFMRDVVEYWGYHADFPPIENGCEVPAYEARFTIRDKDPYREVGMDQTREIVRVFIGWKDSIAQGVDS